MIVSSPVWVLGTEPSPSGRKGSPVFAQVFSPEGARRSCHTIEMVTALSSTGPGAQATAAAEGLPGGDRPSLYHSPSDFYLTHAQGRPRSWSLGGAG